MVLASVDDHQRQEQAWAGLPSWNQRPEHLRQLLTRGEIESDTDPLARFVTLKAYEKAGGPLRRDLFSDDDRKAYLLDPTLLERLAADKLGKRAKQLLPFVHRYRSASRCSSGRVSGRSCTLAVLGRKYTHRRTHTECDVETLTTRVFNNGNSQAVRIPAEFRLDTDRVSISRNESGDLVIHPLRAERGAALLDALRAVGEADVAFIAALETERARQQPLQEREAL